MYRPIFGEYFTGQIVKIKPCNEKQRQKRAATKIGYRAPLKDLEGENVVISYISNKSFCYVTKTNDLDNEMPVRTNWIEPVMLTYKKFME